MSLSTLIVAENTMLNKESIFSFHLSITWRSKTGLGTSCLYLLKHRKRVVCRHFSRVWLCSPVDCSPPGYPVHGILQARVLEWVAMPSPKTSHSFNFSWAVLSNHKQQCPKGSFTFPFSGSPRTWEVLSLEWSGKDVSQGGAYTTGRGHVNGFPSSQERLNAALYSYLRKASSHPLISWKHVSNIK